jgi:oligopeptide/dipeptide ABC transporter ATP-binding protein
MDEKEKLLASETWDDAKGFRFGELEELIFQYDGYNALSEVESILSGLGIAAQYHDKPLKSLSGGYKLRVLLAQTLFQRPSILLLDEPTNHLDIISIQWLEQFLKTTFKGLIIFISHDLNIVRYMCDRVMVMYLGNIMEIANSKNIFEKHYHPYTEALLSSLPVADPVKQKNKVIKLLDGDLPSPINPPKGCVFSTRCHIASIECQQIRPDLKLVDGGIVRCLKR